MQNIFLPSFRTFESIVRLLLNTNLFALILFYLLAFIGIAVVMVTLFETFMSGLRDVSYTRALDQATLILGFIFSMWITSYARGYSAQVAKFSELVQSIENMAFDLFNISNAYGQTQCHDDVVHSNNNNNNNNGNDTDDAEHMNGNKTTEFCKIMRTLHDLCLALVSTSYRLFADDEPDRVDDLEGTVDELLRKYQYGNNHQLALHVFAAAGGLFMSKLKLLELSHKFITTGDKNMLVNDWQVIRKSVNEIEASVRVCESPLFNKIMFGSLAVYFILWVPYVQWVLLGAVPTIFMYPVVMLLLTMPVIAFEWQGNAFSRSRPIQYMNLYRWRYRAYARITHAYAFALGELINDRELQTMRQNIFVTPLNGRTRITLQKLHDDEYNLCLDV